MEKGDFCGLLRALRMGEAYASIQDNLHAAINLKSWTTNGVMPMEFVKGLHSSDPLTNVRSFRDSQFPNIARVGKGHSKYPEQWKKWA